MYDFPFSYWAWFGTIGLIIMTFWDYRNNMNVDDRKNYFMMGISISLLTHLERSLWFILLLLVLVIVLNISFRKLNVLGEADISCLTWIIYGFGIINPFVLLWFCIFFLSLTVVYHFFKIVVFKYKPPTPFFYVLLLSFVLINFLYRIY